MTEQRSIPFGAAALHDIPLARIVIGERYRRDMGDLQALAEDIQSVGLLQPIGVVATGPPGTPERKAKLVFGERRLRAVALLGWATIPAFVLDFDELTALIAERAE